MGEESLLLPSSGGGWASLVGNGRVSSFLSHSAGARPRMDVLFVAFLAVPLILGKSTSDPEPLYLSFCGRWDERKDIKRRQVGMSAGSDGAFSAAGVQARGQSRDLEGGAGKPRAKQRQVLSKKRRLVEAGVLKRDPAAD